MTHEAQPAPVPDLAAIRALADEPVEVIPPPPPGIDVPQMSLDTIPAPTEPTGEREALVAAVLAQHRIIATGPGEVACRCSGTGWMRTSDYNAHVAAAVVAALSPTPHDGTEGAELNETRRQRLLDGGVDANEIDGTEGGGE